MKLLTQYVNSSMRVWPHLVVAFALCLSGCEDEGDSIGKATSSDPRESDNAGPDTNNGHADQSPITTNPTTTNPVTTNGDSQPATIVEVKLAARDAEKCLVKQGDVFPDGSLVTADGQQRRIDETYGTAATVVLFWSNESPYSIEWLKDLYLETIGQHARINVTLINVGGDPQADSVRLSEIAAEAGHEQVDQFDALYDQDQSYFHRVATEGLPRIFLLDAEGKILWFGIDRSPATYGEYESAVRHVIAQLRQAG